MAAVLAGGEDAVLSNNSAGAFMQLISYSGRAHVTVPKPRRRRLGIVWHSSALPVDEVERLDGIPVTTPARTLLDLAAVLDRRRLEDRFLAFLDLNRLPRPETNVWMEAGEGWVEVDCVWRESQLVAELDGRAFHETAPFETDRARDRALVAAGWAGDPGHVEATNA
jgi:hypothetical protein